MDVKLVQWSQNDISKGRVISLDERNCIICPVNYASRTRSFQHADIIMPCVGERVQRVRKHERPALPLHPLRLLRMYSCAISLHCHSERGLLFDGAELACVICSSSTGDVFTCAFCLQSVHESCCNKLTRDCADAWRRSASVCGQSMTPQMIPNILLAPSGRRGSASSSSDAPSEFSPWRECLVCIRRFRDHSGEPVSASEH